MDNQIIWLIRLLAAHLFTDFVLQPKSWVKSRKEKHLASPAFWVHIGLTTFFAAWFTGFDTWWVPLAIFTTHGLSDWWKSYRKDQFLYFGLDQLFHLAIIFLIWLIRFEAVATPMQWIKNYEPSPQFWMIGLAVVFLSTPVGIVIGMLTKPFRERIRNHKDQSLENAGTWIGVMERLIIFFLVLVNQFEAIGLLIAAKSIIRFKEGEQKMSEYVLIGTLLSVSVAMVTGFIVSKLI